MNLMKYLFDGMPREFATPRRTMTENRKELLQAINNHNGKTNVYIGMYQLPDKTYESAVINKALFDFDNDGQGFHDAQRFLMAKNIKHLCIFSGSNNSYHIYVPFEEPTTPQCLELFQKWVAYKSNTNPDTTVMGRPDQVVRVPNTYHIDAGRFCIPIKREWLLSAKGFRGTIEPVDKSYKQRHVETEELIMGEKEPNPNKYEELANEMFDEPELGDVWKGASDGVVIDVEKGESVVDPEDITVDLPCLKQMLNSGEAELGHKERQTLISYLNEQGYFLREIIEFLKQELTSDKAFHSIKEERQPHRIVQNGVVFPSCKTLKNREMCPTNCNQK